MEGGEAVVDGGPPEQCRLDLQVSRHRGEVSRRHAGEELELLARPGIAQPLPHPSRRRWLWRWRITRSKPRCDVTPGRRTWALCHLFREIFVSFLSTGAVGSRRVGPAESEFSTPTIWSAIICGPATAGQETRGERERNWDDSPPSRCSVGDVVVLDPVLEGAKKKPMRLRHKIGRLGRKRTKN